MFGFTRSAAQIWRFNIRPQALRLRIRTDPHSPGNFRCNAPLSNLPEFMQAFNIKEGAPMPTPGHPPGTCSYQSVSADYFQAMGVNLIRGRRFDNRDQEQSRCLLRAGEEILSKCAEMGGSITGEHGVGIEKNEMMPLIFSADDLEMMRQLKAAFNPTGLLNPGKVLPTGKMCGELRVQISAGAAA